MTAPRITIITTNDRSERELEATVRSVLNQGYENLEFRVINSGDAPATIEVLKKFEHRLSWRVAQETWNVARLLNNSFARASGTLLLHVPGGTRLDPDALKRIAERYQRDGAQWIVGWTQKLDRNDRPQPQLVRSHARPIDWLIENPLPDDAVVLATELWRETGRFDESLKLQFKYEYWLRLRFSANIGPRLIESCVAANSVNDRPPTADEEIALHRELKRVKRRYRGFLPLTSQLQMLNATRLRQAQKLRAEALQVAHRHDSSVARKLALASLARDAMALDAWQIAAGGSNGAVRKDKSPARAAAARSDRERRMRVTVVCSMYPPALAPEAAHASLLCEHLADSGCDVTLITSDIDGISDKARPYTLRNTMKGWTWSDAPRLLKELKRSEPDVVLLIYLGWIYDRHPMVTFLPTLCRRLKKTPRVIVQFENSQGAELRRARQWRAWKAAAMLAGRSGLDHRFGTLLRDSDRVITLCHPHLEELMRHYLTLPRKTTVIPAPPLLSIVPLDRADAARRETRSRLGYKDDDFVVAYFGYIYPEKGVEIVIEAAGTALARVPNLRLLMIGGVPGNLAERDPTYPERVRSLVQEKGLADRTFWTGHCEPESEAASSYLHSADAVLLPFMQGVRQNNSSFSVVTTHGLPVITTRGDNIEAEFHNRENCMLFGPGDAPAAAEAIVEVATNATLRAALRAGSLTYANGRAAWPAVIRQTLEVLRPMPADARSKATAQPPVARITARPSTTLKAG